jgi:hypothetical protein
LRRILWERKGNLKAEKREGTNMPKKVHKIAKALMRKGMAEDKAWAIANSKKIKKGDKKGKK